MKKFKTVLSVLAVALIFILQYIYLPAFSIKYAESIFFLGVYATIIVAVIMIWCDKLGIIKRITYTLSPIIVAVAVLILGNLIGAPLFYNKTMYKQLGKVEEKEFSEEIENLQITQIPYVDTRLAAKIGDKKLGEDAALGSQVEVGEFTVQNVDGKLSLVAPLVHSGFFKWMSNREGTPGYIKISATNPQDVEFIKEANGVDIKIKYQESAFFAQDLKRHIRSEGFMTDGITDYSFELDDNGLPFWVVTTYKPTTIFTNSEATGIILVNAITGECTKYDIKNSPKWIDRIQPQNFVENQIINYGKYVRGVFNFSNKDKLKPTDGMSIVYSKGECYYYTGLTSFGSDDGTVGFLLVNTRDKKVSRYAIAGAHENAAMRSAEGKVQNLKYIAAFPLPVNIDNIPTYFLTLKDNEGLIKKFAFVNIKDYGVVGVGDTIADAKKDYLSLLRSSGNNIMFNTSMKEEEMSGAILRIASKVIDGNSQYTFLIEGKDKIFNAPASISEEIALTREFDTVVVKYLDSEDSDAISVTSFNNTSILD